jgi:hypothetical protein
VVLVVVAVFCLNTQTSHRATAWAMCMFLYCGTVLITPGDAVYLMSHVCRQYNLSALQAVCERKLSGSHCFKICDFCGCI